MKTHKARWAQNSPTAWILKEPSKDGGAVLARLNDERRCQSGGWAWRIESDPSPWWNWSGTRYTAQRAVRVALLAARTGIDAGLAQTQALATEAMEKQS